MHYVLKSLFCLMFSLATLALRAQQSVWITASDSGDLYCLDPERCTIRFKCNTGKTFMDIAFTPDGRLWGNTPDTLYEIDTADCSLRVIGHVPPSKSLVGLNDSTLLLDSLRDLYSVSTLNAAKHLIGHVGRPLDGDLTWIGRDLYARGTQLIKIVLDSSYTSLLAVDTIVNANPAYNYYYFTPAFATMYTESHDTMIVAIPGIGLSNVFILDPQDASYQTLCMLEEVKNTYGATCMTFPPSPPAPPVLSVAEKVKEAGWKIYPNPAADKVYLKADERRYRAKALTCRLFDPAGRLLLQEMGRSVVDLGKYAPGIYMLQLSYEDKCLGWEKIVKQ